MAGPGVIFDSKTPISRKGIEPTQVKSIKLVSDLDDGAANDGNGTIKEKSGLIFGKTYTFKVESYTNEEPKDVNLVKWAVSYTDKETGKFYKNVLKDTFTGDEISITFNDSNGCGNDLNIIAYINDADNEGKLTQFKHNRFRFFDRIKLINELEARKTEPWRINQDDTNTCGPSAIMYSFAKRDKENYAKFIADLHRKGITQFNNYKIDISSDGDLKDIADTNPKTKENFPTAMASCDWIPNTCITDDENIFFDFEGNTKETFSAITVPSRMKMLNEKLLGLTDVKDNTNLYFNKTGWVWGATLEDVAELINTKSEGYEVFLLVSIDLLNNSISKSLFSTAEHWIVLESIKHGAPGFVEFNIYTWGKNPTLKTYNISYDIFRTNYYGYIKAK
ncbi:hypothetical protein VUJ46_01690 [Chryseobacterium sp. MYb264]|uniref:hypothetical protein n=1 Tax=Chryseobacterium sp. MYb264 TaxID=2745153 RepID=UPI002E0E2412|nr:hypothetical protein VUJ46_01690 [Chryseobacterium sp. MYb264]